MTDLVQCNECEQYFVEQQGHDLAKCYNFCRVRILNNTPDHSREKALRNLVIRFDGYLMGKNP